MSSFIVKLWEDIFTPGPTPTILKAANASFAALQIVLFCLLLAASMSLAPFATSFRFATVLVCLCGM